MARRVDRAEFCPLLRHGRNASHASSGAREHIETAAGSCGRFQSEFGDASGDGIRHPAWIAGRLGLLVGSVDSSGSRANPSRDHCIDPVQLTPLQNRTATRRLIRNPAPKTDFRHGLIGHDWREPDHARDRQTQHSQHGLPPQGQHHDVDLANHVASISVPHSGHTPDSLAVRL